MWEFWRSKLSKGKTRHKRRDLDTGSDEDSPSTVRSMELTDSGMPGTSPENSSHGRCVSLFVMRSARVGVACKAANTNALVMQCTSRTSYYQPVMTTMRTSQKMCNQTSCQTPLVQKGTALMSHSQTLAL